MKYLITRNENGDFGFLFTEGEKIEGKYFGYEIRFMFKDSTGKYIRPFRVFYVDYEPKDIVYLTEDFTKFGEELEKYDMITSVEDNEKRILNFIDSHYK